jgi:hypothetical protein
MLNESVGFIVKDKEEVQKVMDFDPDLEIMCLNETMTAEDARFIVTKIIEQGLRSTQMNAEASLESEIEHIATHAEKHKDYLGKDRSFRRHEYSYLCQRSPCLLLTFVSFNARMGGYEELQNALLFMNTTNYGSGSALEGFLGHRFSSKNSISFGVRSSEAQAFVQKITSSQGPKKSVLSSINLPYTFEIEWDSVLQKWLIDYEKKMPSMMASSELVSNRFVQRVTPYEFGWKAATQYERDGNIMKGINLGRCLESTWHQDQPGKSFTKDADDGLWISSGLYDMRKAEFSVNWLEIGFDSIVRVENLTVSLSSLLAEYKQL